jgi:8-oxo-dGTP diphosphatase
VAGEFFCALKIIVWQFRKSCGLIHPRKIYAMRKVAIVLIEDESGRVILQLRDDKPGLIHANLYSFFGGAVEPGETPSAAALRELSEELSIPARADKLGFLWRVISHQPQGVFDLRVFHYRMGDEIRDVVVTEGQGMELFRREDITDWGRFSDVAQECLTRFWQTGEARAMKAKPATDGDG